jgi:hypothetical protein
MSMPVEILRILFQQGLIESQDGMGAVGQ